MTPEQAQGAMEGNPLLALGGTLAVPAQPQPQLTQAQRPSAEETAAPLLALGGTLAERKPAERLLGMTGEMTEGERRAGVAARGIGSAVAGSIPSLAHMGVAGLRYLDKGAKALTEAMGIPVSDEKDTTTSIIDWLDDFIEPATISGIKRGIDERTGYAYTPEGYAEKVLDTATEFIGAGGALGALGKGHALQTVVGSTLGAAAGEALPEDAHPLLKAGVTIGADILGRKFTPSKAAQDLSRIRKITPLDKEAIEAARRQGLELPVGAETSSSVASFAERALEQTPFTHGKFAEAADRMTGDVLNKLENRASLKFGAIPGSKAALEAEVQAGVREGLEATATQAEQALSDVVETVGTEGLKAPTTRAVYDSVAESGKMLPEGQKFVNKLGKDLFVGGEELSSRLSEIHPEEVTKFELGNRVQEAVKTARKNTKLKATDEYDIFKANSATTEVPVQNLDAARAKLYEVRQELGDRELPTKFESLMKSVEKQIDALNKLSTEKTIPLRRLTTLEQDLHAFIDYASEHGASNMLIPVRQEVEKAILASLKNSPAVAKQYLNAKKTYSKYIKDFIEAEATNKIHWSQKPEEISSLLKKPSYTKQIMQHLPEELQQQTKRHVYESVLGKEAIAKGNVTEKAVDALKEYKTVLGDEFNDIQRIAEDVAGKETIKPQKLVSGIQKIDERLGQTIGKAERNSLTKMRQALVQDLRARSPEAAESLTKGIGEAGTQTQQVQKKLLQSVATGDPSKILSSIRTVEDFNTLKSSLKGVKNGDKILDSVRRMKIQEELGNHIFTDGKLSFAKLDTALTRMLKDPLTRALMGPENIKFYQDIQKHAGLIKTASKTFANPSGSAHMYANIKAVTVLAGALGSFLTGDATPLILAMGSVGGMKMAAKILTDPKLKKHAVNVLNNLAGTKAVTPESAYKLLKPFLEEALIINDEVQQQV